MLDPLSDVLSAVRLTGAYFYLVEAASPWSVDTIAACDFAPRVLPEAEHLIAYHVLVSGTCWGGVQGEAQVQMRPGDVILFAHGDPHYMSSAPGFRDGGAPYASAGRLSETLVIGPRGGTAETILVCGFLGCDARPFNPLLSSLPRRLLVPGIAAGWLSQFPRQAVAESRAPRVGSTTMLTRMAELMFIELMRHYLAELPADQAGWLRALRDNVTTRALSLLHERPAYPWTLAELAEEAATSRTVLAERFKELVGLSPMLYLSRWRLQLGAQRLVSSSAKVATIAAAVGYESEAAFSRAFKRETGLSPAAWRKARE